MPLSNNNQFFGNCCKKIAEFHENSLLRFLFVGALGTIVNVIIFYIFADYFNFNANISSIIAFCVAVTHNYLLNHLWIVQEICKFSGKQEKLHKICLCQHFWFNH